MDPTNNYVPGESGFVNRIADAASLQWMGLVEYAGRRLSQRVDEDYKAWEDEANRGYEDS